MNQRMTTKGSDGDDEGTLGPDCGLQPVRDFQNESVEKDNSAPKRLPKEQRGWRKVVRNFTPS